MMNFRYALLSAARLMAKFVGLTILALLALCISAVINFIAIAYPHFWVLTPGLQALSSGISHLASLSHSIGFGGA